MRFIELRWGIHVIRSALFVILQRGWLAISGFILVLMIPSTLTELEQGVFFTFLSFAAIQSLFEAGISTVVLQFIAHEYAQITQSSSSAEKHIVGAKSRFSALVKFAKRWFVLLAALFILIVGSLGYLFFDSDLNIQPVDWRLPWVVINIAVGLSLINISLASILEGMGNVSDVAIARLSASIVSSIVLWIMLWGGWGLWALSISYLLQSLLAFVILSSLHKISPLLNGELSVSNSQLKLDWLGEIFPLQSKLALSFFCGYLSSSAIVPFVFKTYGPIEAGKIGLTLAIFNAIAAILYSLVYAANPKYGFYAQQKKWEELKCMYKKVTRISISIAIPSYVFLICLAIYLSGQNVAFMGRVSDVEILGALSLIGLVNIYSGSVATMLRSFKKEPMLTVSIMAALVTVGLMALGPIVSIIEYFEFVSIFYLVAILPLTVWIRKKKWEEYAS